MEAVSAHYTDEKLRFHPTCLNNSPPKLWQMDTIGRVSSALLLRTKLTRWRKSRAKSSTSAEDFEKATVESYPYVNILASGSCSGRKSRSHSFPLSVQVRNLSPPRPWIAKILSTCQDHTKFDQAAVQIRLTRYSSLYQNLWWQGTKALASLTSRIWTLSNLHSNDLGALLGIWEKSLISEDAQLRC
jgi:hypothetical protein